MTQPTFDGFDKYYDIVYGPNAYEEGSAEIDFYIQECKGNDQILEIACGTGRIMLPLLQEGLKVIGLDLYEGMLQFLHVKADMMSLEADTRLGDMRNFDLQERFPVILIPLNSLQHLDNDGQKSTLSCAYKHLEDGGKLIFTSQIYTQEILDQTAEEYTYVDSYEAPQWEIDIDLYIKYEQAEGKIREKFIVHDGNLEEDEISYQLPDLYLLNVDKIKSMLIDIGFQKLEISEDFKGTAFKPNESDIVVWKALK